MEDITKNLTDKQRKALEKLKVRLEDVLTPEHTDATLVKWLRARNYDDKGAEQIFREMYNNRIMFGINAILETYEKPEVAEKYEASVCLGFAKDGTVIRYTAAGRLDFNGFIMSMSCYELCLYFSHMVESDIQALKEQSLKIGRTVEEITFIMDLEGFHLQQIMHRVVIEMVLDFTRLLQDCYPEIWRHIFVVNAPSIFHQVFNIIKPVVRVHSLERFKVVSKDSTKDLLLKYIDEDVLPAFLGGKRVDSNGDPMCKEFVKFGGKVPEKFYALNRSTPLLSPDDTGVISFVLGQRSIHNVPVVAKEGGVVNKVQLLSENGSLTMSVFYRKFEEGEDPNNPELPSENECLDETDENSRYRMVTVCMRPQTHCTPMDLEGYLERPGIYIIKFSNAGNWFTTRKVLMRYKLHPPDEAARKRYCIK